MTDGILFDFDADDGVAGLAERWKDRFFDPWMVPRSATAHAFVRDVRACVEAEEAATKPRQRRRRATDQNSFEAAVGALASNLAMSVAAGTMDEGFVVSRSNRVLARASRYRALAENPALPHVLDILAGPGLGFLVQDLGVRAGEYGRRTVVKPTARLSGQVEELGLTVDDFGRAGMEPIVLRAAKTEQQRRREHTGTTLLYADTDETVAMRQEMVRINAALFSADLCIDEAELREGTVVQSSDRQLRRLFTEGRFACGGRLFGGFWQGMKTAERLAAITIAGEPVVELDYGQMSLRILYGRAGVPAPLGDLYTVPGLERWRSGIKTFLNARIFDTGERRSRPRNTATGLPPHLKATQLASVLASAMPAIAPYFGSGIGHELQRTESDIIIAVLLRLLDHGVLGLPIHDAILVPASRAALARETMLEVFRLKVGQDGVVTEETI